MVNQLSIKYIGEGFRINILFLPILIFLIHFTKLKQMPSIVVIDLQPLACIGLQAYLRKLLPASQCQIVYSKEAIDTLQPSAEPGIVILGINQEDRETAFFLRQKALDIGEKVPVIVMYEDFDIEHLRQFAAHTPTGFISKDNVVNQLAECIVKIRSGNSFLCETTRQHIINAYTTSPSTPPYKQK